ncbi:MAG: carbohydrate-binding protein [Paraprevotella clara]|uniref:carbohydrate-binding protein n=1 Tax=Paraprevotella clara TaxID=454154 RepID=UPI0039A0890F
MIEIKDNNEVLVLSTPIGVGSKRKFELMKDDYITLKFSLLNPISFKMGCYAECDFGRFEIIEDQKPSFNNSTGGYDYELKMEASYMKWKNKVFKYTPETGGNEAAWDLTAQLSYHLDIFLRNLKVWGFQYGGEDYEYEIDNDVNVDALVMHYSNTNLIDALTSLAEAANCEWWMEGKKIRFGRCEKGEAVEISLGEEAETMSLSKSSGDYFTRIYAFGSTQNISSRYRKKLEFTIDTLNRSGNKSDFKDSKKPVNPSFFRKDLIKYYSYEKQMDGVGSVSASLATPDVEEYELYDSITINAMQLYKSAYVLDLSSMVFSYDFSSFPNAVLDVRVEIVASGNDSSTVLSESSYTIDSSNKTLRLSKERFESPYETIRKLYLRITYSCVSPLVTYIPYTIVGDCILGSVYGYVETDVNYVSDDGGNHKIGVTINRNAMPYTDEHATLLYETTSNDKLYIGAKFTIEGLVKGNVPLGYFDSDVDGLTVNGVVQRRLMLPEGTPYIDVYPDMSPDEVIEGIVTFDYIYPRKVLSISSVEEEMIDTTEGEEKKPTGMKVPVYTIKTTGLVGFDKSYVISEELTVTFQTGKLAGLTFGLTFLPDKSDGTSTCFEIVANEDYGGRLPDTVMKPEANNEFVMAGYDTEYVFENLVPEAEEELKTETEKYAEKIRNNIGTVSAKLMSDWSKARNETQDTPCPFGVGQKVRVNNPSFFPSPRTMRVLGYELALDIPWDSPVYTIGESASYSRLGALEDKIDSIKLNGSVYFSGKVSSSTSGTNVYLIKKDDETDPSDTNAYSSLRTDKEIKDSINKNNRELDNKFVSKLKDDTASGIITFLRGLIIGNFSSGESGGQISDDGAAELASLLLRGALEIGKYSAGKSGAKIGEDGAAELLSMLVRGLVTAKGIQSPGFSTGALGTGLCLKMDENGDSYIEVDRMLVRKVAEFIQLVIQEIKHVGGQIVLTPASMKCIRVEDTGDSYRCYFEATDGEKTVENQFVAGDQARAQTFNVKEGVNENVKNTYYWRLVTGVGDNYIDLSKTDCDAGSTVPAAGDEIVQLGNRNDVARQAAIILSAYGNDAPYFKMYRGINSYKLEGKEFVNLSREDVMIISDNIKLSTGETVKEYINGAVGDVQSKVDEVSGKVEDAVERLAEQQNYIAALQKIIEDLQDQIDGVIESHYGKTDPTTSNYPANEWTTEEQKQAHSNDTYTNLSTGKSWKWVKDGDTWKWNAITDTATEKALAAAAKAQDTADGKRRVFVSQPTTGQAYDVGDLWVNATYWETYKNDLLRCKTAKKENEAFSISHWELASRYTDDTKANEAAEAAREAAEAANAAQEAADEAAATAGEAKTEAQTANTELDNLKSDGTISPVEKTALKQQHADIKAEHGQITSEAGKYSISVTDYEAAYKKADAALTKYTASTPEYITVESDYSDISAYYSKRQTILDTIAVKAKEASDAAKKAADDAAAKAEEAAESASEAAQKAIEAKTAADNAATAAKNAQTDADEANSMLSDIANDNKLTAQEKQQTKKEWDVIVSEKPKNDVSADKFGVSKTAYGSAYTALSTYITPLLSDLSSTSNITGTEFRAKFKAYYDARTDLLNAISAKAKELADNAQEAADAAAENASQAIEDAAAAKNAADKAQADVDAEKERMDEWAADGKFSPSEKKQLKEELARIDGDKTQVTDGYTKYGLGTPTAYNTAYTNYRTAINGVVSSSSETVAIPSDFATKRTAYYTQKSAALTAISDAAKAYADKVVAGIEVGGRNILMETNQGKKTWYASTSDGPSLFITTEWVDEGVKGVKIELTKQPSSWGVITRSLEGTLDLLEPNTTYMLSFDILSNISNTLSTTIMNSNATGRLSNSPSFSFEANKKKHVVLKLVTNDLSEKGSSQVLYFGYHSVGYLCFKNLKLEKGNVATAWTPAIEDVNGMIEDAQKAADDAAEAAKNAQADATNANNELTNIKSDNLISPIEKTALKQQQADIRSEYGEITANAARYAVSTTAYKSAYDLANAALTKYTASSPEYITVGSDYANISAYYDARKTILDAIAAAAKKAADDATNKANQAVEDAARAGHYYLDLDNDSGQVACDADGNVTGGYPTTNAKVWYGTEVDTGWSFKGTFSGCTGSVGASSGAVTVTAVSKDDASVTITATKSGKPELSAVFTIVKVKSGRDGEDGANGTSVTVKSTSVTYAVSTSGTTAPASGWSATIPSVPVGQYLWSKTVVTYSDGKSTTTHSCSYQGKNGANGTSVTVTAQSTKYAVNTTGNQPADSAFTATSIPSLSPGQYLWSKTEVTYSNGVTTKTYAVSRIGSDGANGTPGAAGANGKTSYVHFAYAKSADGNTGFSTTYFSGALYVGTCTDFNTADPTSYTAYTWARLKGEDGANGTSVTVKSTSVTYAVSTSGTTAPASGWSATIPSVPVGQYLWSKTVVTYSDGKSTTTHSCSYQGKNGANGTSVTVTAQSTKYAVNTTGNQPADSAFTATSIPSLSPGQYLWSKTEVTYSNGVTTKTYAVSRIGSDGANGTPGAAGANGKTSYVHFAYAKSADGNTGFSTTYFSGALYVGTCTDFNTADPTSYTAYTWARLKGEDGANGTSVTVKSTSVTYAVSTSGTTAPASGWSATIPSVPVGQYLWSKTVVTYSDGKSTTTHSCSYQGKNGANGTSVTVTAQSTKYAVNTTGNQPADSAFTATSIPSLSPGQYLWSKTEVTYSNGVTTKTYAVSRIGSDGANGTPGAAGANGKTSYVHFAYAKSADGNTGFSTTYFSGALYVGTCTDFNTADPTSYTAYTWARLKGEDGAPGNGIKSTAVTYQVSTSGTTPPTGTWSSSIPSVAANQYLWTRTVITYTDNTTSTSYSVGKMGANGAKGDKGDTGPAGADGDGIVSVSNTYQIGSSGTTAPTGSWSSTVPSPQKGKYLWTKTVTTYKKSDPTTVYSVSYYGTDGTAAKYVRVAGDQVFIYANNFSGNPTPTSITLTATLTGTSGYQWSYKQAGQTSFTNISGATSQTYALAHNNSTVWGSAKSVTIRCTSGGVYDEMTIAKVSSGTNGTNGKDGTNGTNGKDGADGKNGADAYTVILGNESHAFQGTTSAAIAASTKCEVIAYKGATRVAATIGTITGAPSGMSTSISSNGTTSASFTVSVTSSLTTGQGVLTVPITVDGKSFTKNFSFSVAFKGNTGATGATGPKGDAAVFYTIEPSANVVKKSWDNKLTPTSVTCTKYKQTGSNARATTTEKTLKYQRVGTDSSVQTAASGSSVTVSPTSTTTSIKFWLYDGSNIIMMQEVPVVGDAVDVYTKVHAEITAAEGEIGLLSTKVTTVTDSVTGLEKEVETNTAEIKSAKGQISSTASQVSSLGTRVSTVEQTASGLTTTVNGLNGKVSKLEQTDSSLTSRITSAEGKVSTIEQKVSSISLKVDGIDPVNLFRDGSFESGYNTFRTSGSGKDDVEVGISANGKVGKNAMMVKWPGKRTTVYLEQKPFVNPNATYTVSFWMYTNVATNYQAFVINALDKNDNNLSVNDSTLNIEIPGTKWTQFIHRFTTPANTERLEFYFRASANVENGTISYIDGFMLLKGDYLDNIPSYFIPNDSVNGDTLLSTGIDIENKKVIVTSDQFVIQNNDGEVTASVNEDGVLSVGSGEFSGFIRTIPRIITKNTGDNGDVEFKDNYYQISLSNLYKGGFIYVDVESNSYAGDGIKLPLGLKYAGARVTIVNKYPAKRLIITTRHEALDPGYGDWSDDENNAMRLGGVQISHVEMGNVSTQGNNRFVELLAVPYYLDETIGSVKYQGQVEWVVLNNQEFTTANNTTGGKYAKFK